MVLWRMASDVVGLVVSMTSRRKDDEKAVNIVTYYYNNDDTTMIIFLKTNDEYFKVLFLQFKPQTVKVSLWTCLSLSHVAVVYHGDGDFDLGLNAVCTQCCLVISSLFWKVKVFACFGSKPESSTVQSSLYKSRTVEL
jgi:hypothetical protein